MAVSTQLTMVTVSLLLLVPALALAVPNQEQVIEADDPFQTTASPVPTITQPAPAGSTTSKPSNLPPSHNNHPINCWFDRNATRGDFHCSSKTCYDFVSGKVTFHRIYCERFKNRVERLDEKSKKAIKRIKAPIEGFNQLFKTSLRDWAALQALEYVAKRMRIA